MRISFAIIFYLLFVSGLSVTWAQSPNREQQLDIPSAPADYILDEAGFFRDAPEKRREVSNSLKAIREKHGYPVYLVIYYSVFDTSLEERATKLQTEWIGKNGHGMVIAYQRDPVSRGSNPAMAYFQGSELDVDQDQSYAQAGAMIPGREMKAILMRVFEASSIDNPKTGAVDYLCLFVFNLERELNEYFAVKPPKWNDSGNLRSILIFAGAVALFSLLAMLLWRLFLGAESRSTQKYYFPDVKVGRRLGAPFGGGWTSERSFVPASSRK